MTDLRETRTRKLIFSGFKEALAQKEFSKMTINDIAQAAMIHRNTFYHHFNDKYDLIHQFVGEALQKLINGKSMIGFNQHPFLTIHNLYVEHFKNVFLLQVRDEEFKQIIWKEFLNEMIKRSDGTENFIALSGLSVIMDWNDLNDQPYDFFNDYQLLDQIYQQKRFPKAKKINHHQINDGGSRL